MLFCYWRIRSQFNVCHPNIRDLTSKFVETQCIKYLFWWVYFMRSCKFTAVYFWVMQWVRVKMDNITSKALQIKNQKSISTNQCSQHTSLSSMNCSCSQIQKTIGTMITNSFSIGLTNHIKQDVHPLKSPKLHSFHACLSNRKKIFQYRATNI